ncbi:MAG: alpha/beta hydrolase, partial [Pseudomonadota bacterium]|nr:alpha/beta hydrolase [Pseudomonadota bacterium]
MSKIPRLFAGVRASQSWLVKCTDFTYQKRRGWVNGNIAGSLIVILLGLLVLNGWMYLQQAAMTFYPDRLLSATPANWGLEYEDVFLTAEDGVQLHGWYIPRQGSDRVLLFLHGNGGNISHRGESVAVFHRLGLNVLIFDYRGYGQSQGEPSEHGLYQDAAAAWHYLTETRDFASEDIILFGRSLGGAVAAKLASEVQAGGLILESTFSSAPDVARSLFPFLSRLVVLRYAFDTAEYLKGVACPLLVLHSPEDD